ncbi:MAG: response regulator [Candidatus Zhuqueibacterota bacterium]
MDKQVPNILLVEDERVMSILIRHNLEKEGFHIDAFENGEKAIEFCSTHVPDLIISDVMMPCMNGFELFKRIKEDERLLNVPFIFLTARAQTADILRGNAMGADDYLTKPIEPALLIEKVRSWLKQRPGR